MFKLNKKISEIKAVTHNSVFHPDEVTAFALLSVFSGHFIEPYRVPHQTPMSELKEFDYVVDIGKKSDGVKFFDHHQYVGGKSSAGLIWDLIGMQVKYPEISELVKMVDDHDTGVRKAGKFEYPSIIFAYNNDDIYGTAQDDSFVEALECAIDFISSLKERQDKLVSAEVICNKALSLEKEGLADVVELSEFTIHWNKFFNGEITSSIGAVIWEDKVQKNWKAQVTPKAIGSFEFNGKKFLQDSLMNFVHAAGFFAVATSREILIEYLKNSRE